MSTRKKERPLPKAPHARASHPGCPPEEMPKLARKYPERISQNPALDLVKTERPDLFQEIEEALKPWRDYQDFWSKSISASVAEDYQRGNVQIVIAK